MSQRFYRIKMTLQDGRVVYASKRGAVELVDVGYRKLFQDVFDKQKSMEDRSVYSVDLAIYAARSLFLGSLQPFVEVLEYEFESEDIPIDPNGCLMGGVPAAGAGCLRREWKS